MLKPFDPSAYFFFPQKNCETCDFRNHHKYSCLAREPQQCPAALEAAERYLLDYLSDRDLTDLLRYSLSDDYLALKIAGQTELSPEEGCYLRDAFLFWALEPPRK